MVKHDIVPALAAAHPSRQRLIFAKGIKQAHISCSHFYCLHPNPLFVCFFCEAYLNKLKEISLRKQNIPKYSKR